ncbi:MAG: DUF362 domain-containing protein [Patescibacteria group bacterium]
MSKVKLYAVKRGTEDDEAIKLIKAAACDAFDDFSWLNPGELVWIKVALNSPDPYPATTDWRAVKAIAELVVAHGGKVAVADESGVEFVEDGDSKVSFSEACYARSGMSKSGQAFLGLETIGFDHFTSPQAEHWPLGFRVTGLAKEADHIINLPRISAHAQAGVTLGAKCWVGALRMEDRYVFHSHGPLYWFIQAMTSKRGVWTPKADKRRYFFEMIAELGLAFRDKLRGTLFVATKVQTTMGPNKSLVKLFNSIGIFPSYVLEPETGLIIASDDPVAADGTALAFLIGCYKRTPWIDRMLQKVLIAANGRIKELGTYGVWDNPMIAHQLKLGLGEKVTALDCSDVPHDLMSDIEKRLGI